MDDLSQPIEIGSRLELFVDDYIVDTMNQVERRLQRPDFQEVAIRHDKPWEGGGSSYHTIFKDGDVYRMYYRASQIGVGIPESSHRSVTAYAESDDGITWQKPDLGLYEWDGSTNNNIIRDGRESHNFTPFKDENPNCSDEAKYKAVGFGSDPDTTNLVAFKSADGIRWSRLGEDPILTEEQGAYDSQNLAFWDGQTEQYRIYFRDFTQEGALEESEIDDRRRIIKTSTSNDFQTWSDPVELTYPDAPPEQLYTNVIKPYYRAPHIYLGFPERYVERDWESDSMRELPGFEFRQQLADELFRTGAAVTDALFMSSRDGSTFSRWPKAFLRPGAWTDDSRANWFYGDNTIAWQLVETKSGTPGKPPVLSLYAKEDYRTEASRLRRYTLRIDGFVSVEAPLDGGELVTKPIVFDGDDLVLNFSTSAAGRMSIELQRPDGDPYPGFELDESPELFGDDYKRVVTWPNGADIADLAGQPVRIRFVMADSDLYSFRFRPA
ncbi:hypothetical protein [Saliphagus sp. LR7]|uniref:hypothetical protein n=1 Tax=Saliphagus sp. LR7 TaxID=2282654 RepID=UPI0018E5295C|nr:hypothetical protein [Saliphagus sp. LR7]